MTLPPNHPSTKRIGGRCIFARVQCLPIRRYSRFHFSDGRRNPVRLLVGAANGKASPTSAPRPLFRARVDCCECASAVLLQGFNHPGHKKRPESISLKSV
ncbi:hypothetical protein CEXT_53891 [Caerostris extrusa]|uniref:Uncharacterized protein n=1 Tax=Caerostris extrusa TaxID=172846 RepID=A0AAV4TQ87_CAEEX|nr:hypothetical protein CEXT_53891 [Caerostris extrusa]